MSAVVISGDTSGTVTLNAPAVAGSTTINLPATSGTAITTGDTGTVTPTMLSQKLTQGAAQASTSGTSIDFTGIPSWAKRITVMFHAVSTSGTSSTLIQLGSGSFTTSGYASTVSQSNLTTSSTSTAGLIITHTASASLLFSGNVIITNPTGNAWCASAAMYYGSVTTPSGGHVTLGGTLDRVRITTVNGTDTFDAGTINIMWE